MTVGIGPIEELLDRVAVERSDVHAVMNDGFAAASASMDLATSTVNLHR